MRKKLHLDPPVPGKSRKRAIFTVGRYRTTPGRNPCVKQQPAYPCSPSLRKSAVVLHGAFQACVPMKHYSTFVAGSGKVFTYLADDVSELDH
jgi:hypothetical protein